MAVRMATTCTAWVRVTEALPSSKSVRSGPPDPDPTGRHPDHRRHGGTKAVAFGIHFATAIVVLISAALMFAL
ncbi:MAG: hypothetical protein ACJ768_24540 [Gaiellaceae bacterium]